VPLRAEGDYAVLDYAKTSQSGIYAANLGSPDQPAALFAVNVDTAESDLAQVDPDELQNEVWQGVHFTRGTVSHESAAAAAAGTIHPVRRLQFELLCGVLALLFFETLLGWALGLRENWAFAKSSPLPEGEGV
jgi:hypothetical protein